MNQYRIYYHPNNEPEDRKAQNLLNAMKYARQQAKKYKYTGFSILEAWKDEYGEIGLGDILYEEIFRT